MQPQVMTMAGVRHVRVPTMGLVAAVMCAPGCGRVSPSTHQKLTADLFMLLRPSRQNETFSSDGRMPLNTDASAACLFVARG
jgi:hypothetical protein